MANNINNNSNLHDRIDTEVNIHGIIKKSDIEKKIKDHKSSISIVAFFVSIIVCLPGLALDIYAIRDAKKYQKTGSRWAKAGVIIAIFELFLISIVAIAILSTPDGKVSELLSPATKVLTTETTTVEHTTVPEDQVPEGCKNKKNIEHVFYNETNEDGWVLTYYCSEYFTDEDVEEDDVDFSGMCKKYEQTFCPIQ